MSNIPITEPKERIADFASDTVYELRYMVVKLTDEVRAVEAQRDSWKRFATRDTAERNALSLRNEQAAELINHAVELMTHEQLGQWAGVKMWLESADDSEGEGVFTARDELLAALRLLAECPVTVGLSAHYRDEAQRNGRVDEFANARSIIAKYDNV